LRAHPPPQLEEEEDEEEVEAGTHRTVLLTDVAGCPLVVGVDTWNPDTQCRFFCVSTTRPGAASRDEIR
jgi:hypothetical protein